MKLIELEVILVAAGEVAWCCYGGPRLRLVIPIKWNIRSEALLAGVSC